MSANSGPQHVSGLELGEGWDVLSKILLRCGEVEIAAELVHELEVDGKALLLDENRRKTCGIPTRSKLSVDADDWTARRFTQEFVGHGSTVVTKL